MNTAKLKHLSARAMGWEIVTDDSVRGYPATFYQKPDGTRIFWQKWNPCEDLNDASALLEKVADGRSWSCVHSKDDYAVSILTHISEPMPMADAKTAALAMTLCSLRASGIPESSITEATKDE